MRDCIFNFKNIFRSIDFVSSMQSCKKTTASGKESMVEIAYIRGGQIRFIVIPDMLKNAPFFERFRMWKKFKGHAVRGLATPIEPVRGGRGGRGFGGGGGGGSGGRGAPRGGDSRPPASGGAGPPIGRGSGAVMPAWQQQQQPPIGGPLGRGVGSIVPAWQQQQQARQGGPGLGYSNPYTSGGGSGNSQSQNKGYGPGSGPSIYGAGR